MTDGFQPADGRPSRDGGFLGLVVDGSLANGIDVRLDPGTAIEKVKVGTFVTIRGTENQFFGVVTDVALGSTDPRLKHGSVDLEDPFISQVLLGTAPVKPSVLAESIKICRSWMASRSPLTPSIRA